MSSPAKIDLKRLHPTQITVGMLEVDQKRRHFASLTAGDLKQALKESPMPAVLGPDKKFYVTDHHHLGRALGDAEIDYAYVDMQCDLSGVSTDAFWDEMIANQWIHPYDEQGMLHGIAALPRHFSGLVDDPFRSLASFVRNAGGYAKTPEPFADFQWAAFFRNRVKLWKTDCQFDAAVQQCTHLARSPDARVLPGFIKA